MWRHVRNVPSFYTKVCKKYANVAEVITNAFIEYAEDVRTGNFPEDKHCLSYKG